MKNTIRLLLASALVVSCSSTSNHGGRHAASEEEYLWLEEVEGPKALAWAKERNEETFKTLKNDPRYAGIEADVRKITLAKDRVPSPSLSGGMIRNYWQDEKNVRGLWRRTSIKNYAKDKIDWEILLDLDALATAENENWVWKGANCLPPKLERCLLSLSRGGKDAVVVREYDLATKKFVDGGFTVPEAKNRVSWIDADNVYVSTDFGPGSMSKSGYAIVTKEWKRGTALSEAKEVYRTSVEDVSSTAYAYFAGGKVYHLRERGVSFFEEELQLRDDNGQYAVIPMPIDSMFKGIFAKELLFELRKDLEVGKKKYVAGTLLALPVKAVFDGRGQKALTEVFRPTKKIFLSSLAFTKDAVLLNVQDNVKGKILRLNRNGSGKWTSRPLPLGKNGVALVSGAEDDRSEYLAYYYDFMTPYTFYVGRTDRSSPPKKIKTYPARFNGAGLKSEQWEATSKDGTKIPYFIVYPKNLAFDGKAPTVLYAYGGFNVSMDPFYLGTKGKVWSEKGGVYVLANIRGGGEFGPSWHQAALKENRQRAYDDFAAVAEDLIKRKVTSPKNLGSQGGSNGGLLMGVAFTQRPDLYSAVACEVPLLDMLRYHKLLAGASWVGEYGDPEKPEERAYIEKYSPFQNVKAGVKYPEVFFLTSTKDDRVHPGHARRMVAKMRDLGQAPLYYENMEGGHGGSANLEQSILWAALEYTYFWRKLGGAEKPAPMN